MIWRPALLCLGVLWQAPAALVVWAFYLLPFWALGYLRPAATHASLLVVEFEPVLRGGWWRRAWDRDPTTELDDWLGHALPHAIVVRAGGEEAVPHELRHCWQWLLLGPLFPVVYGVLLVLFGYARHPLESDARRASVVKR